MDGFDNSFWNLLALIAWVRLRDREIVALANAAEPIRQFAYRRLRWPNVAAPPEPASQSPSADHPSDDEAAGAAIWDNNEALEEIWSAFQVGEVAATGWADGTGKLKKIKREAWASLVPSADLIDVEFRHRDKPPIVRITATSLDVVNAKADTRWTNIRVERSAILARWPVAGTSGSQQSNLVEQAPAQLARTGLAGRPTIWQRFEHECRRRHALRETHPTTREWARVLLAWHKGQHPLDGQISAKTLCNKLAGLLRELKAEDA